MLRAFLLVGAGGFAGSVLRYAITLLAQKYTTVQFPLATFLVNITGCFIIGLLFGLGQRHSWMQEGGWLVLATGFCGGFTTFSTFALDQHALLDKGQYLTTVIYAGLSLALGLLLCRAGILLSR